MKITLNGKKITFPIPNIILTGTRTGDKIKRIILTGIMIIGRAISEIREKNQLFWFCNGKKNAADGVTVNPCNKI